jgi:hypothetical protein
LANFDGRRPILLPAIIAFALPAVRSEIGAPVSVTDTFRRKRCAFVVFGLPCSRPDAF